MAIAVPPLCPCSIVFVKKSNFFRFKKKKKKLLPFQTFLNYQHSIVKAQYKKSGTCIMQRCAGCGTGNSVAKVSLMQCNTISSPSSAHVFVSTLTVSSFFTLDPDRALNYSQQVKDDGIVIVGLGISPVDKEMLQKIVSSQDQVVIFPRFEPDAPVKENTTTEVTEMLCEGIYKIREILRARSLVDTCV